MLRRNSGRWSVVLLLGVASIFLPVAAAASDERPIQTLTVLALVASLVAVGLVWLALRQAGYVRAGYLGAAALTGPLISVTMMDFVGDFAGLPREPLAARFFISAIFNGLGVWLFTVGLRRVFPRRNRGMACAAIVLALFGLFPGPFLLRQDGVAAMNITDIETQLQAGLMYWTTGAVIMVGPFLALLTLPGDWFERAWGWASSRAMAISNKWFIVGLLLFTFGAAAFLAIYSFNGRPTTADEVAQLWHARMLLEGRLAMPPDPNPEFFAIDNVIDRPLWMSQFPIGGPAYLAIGLLFGAAWLLNPILTALLAYNVYRFAQRAYGEAQARAAAAVVAVSPMLLMMGGTYMNHTPTAWLVTAALAALPIWVASAPGDTRARVRAAAIIGLTIGCATTIRPLDGVLSGILIGLVMLGVAARDRADGAHWTRARSILVAIVAGAIPVGLLLIANWRTTGHPTRFGYEMLWGPNHSLGLHDDPTGNPHTAWRALLLAVKYTLQTNWITTAWPVPVVLIVSLGLMLGRRPRMWDVVLLGLFAAQLIMYAFYWHDGQFIGPRFLFTAVPALLILAARAPFAVGARVTGVWRRIAIAVIPVCVAVAWLRSMQPFGLQGIATEFRESRSRLKVDPPPYVENALIFVQEGASSRLLHRLWGLGVSRRDAARIFRESDACLLLEAVIAEEARPASDTAGRVARIQAAVKPYAPTPKTIQFPDRNFRISDPSSVPASCAEEVAYDSQVKNTVAYGAMLLLNRFDDSGRVNGPAVFVMDLNRRNDVLRTRFGDRVWYRYEIPRDRADSTPVLVRYDSTRVGRLELKP